MQNLLDICLFLRSGKIQETKEGKDVQSGQQDPWLQRDRGPWSYQRRWSWLRWRSLSYFANLPRENDATLSIYILRTIRYLFIVYAKLVLLRRIPPRVTSWSIQTFYDPRRNSIVLQSSMTVLGPWLSVALFSYYIKRKKLHCTYYSKMNISERKRTDLLFPMYVCATIKVGNFYNISSSSHHHHLNP